MPENQHNPMTPLLHAIVSVEDADSCVSLIDQVMQRLYATDASKLASLLESTLPTSYSVPITAYLQEQSIDLGHHDQVRSALVAIQKSIRAMRTIHLTIAIKPNARLLRTLGGMAKEQFGDDVVIDASTNEELIGGAVIVYEGRYLDYSVKKKLDILFEAKREEIMKLISGHSSNGNEARIENR